MKIKLLFILLISASLLITCKTPESQPQNWYKGNLHTHTYWSDGDEFPEMVLDWYKRNGYDFVALSDHNTLARDEKWKLITKSPIYEESFQKYLDKFGKDWVVYKTDTGRIQVKLKTYEEYKSKMEDAAFLVIPSEEITNSVNDKPVHINATNLQEFVAPPAATTVAEAMQLAVDAVIQQRERTGIPMFTHINHPNFFWGITVEDMISLKGERFFEVYNGHPMVRNYGDSLHLGMEAMWDQINIAYANRNQPLMYGLATDDSHNYHGAIGSRPGRGWIMVRAAELSADALMKAVHTGDFYFSSGVRLEDVRSDSAAGILSMVIHADPDVTYETRFVGTRRGYDQATEPALDEKGEEIPGRSRYSAEIGEVLGIDHSLSPVYRFKGDELYVRAVVTSSRPHEYPSFDNQFQQAWTQPLCPASGSDSREEKSP